LCVESRLAPEVQSPILIKRFRQSIETPGATCFSENATCLPHGEALQGRAGQDTVIEGEVDPGFWTRLAIGRSGREKQLGSAHEERVDLGHPLAFDLTRCPLPEEQGSGRTHPRRACSPGSSDDSGHRSRLAAAARIATSSAPSATSRRSEAARSGVARISLRKSTPASTMRRAS